MFLDLFLSYSPRKTGVPDEILAGLSGSGTFDGPLFCTSALTIYFRLLTGTAQRRRPGLPCSFPHPTFCAELNMALI